MVEHKTENNQPENLPFEVHKAISTSIEADNASVTGQRTNCEPSAKYQVTTLPLPAALPRCRAIALSRELTRHY